MFGDGRTALKASIGRYVGKMATTIGALGHPLSTSVNSANRTWTDNNGNYRADCDFQNLSVNGECGAISNVNFGLNNPNAQRYDDDLLRGFGVRDYFWDLTAEVQHQLDISHVGNGWLLSQLEQTLRSNRRRTRGRRVGYGRGG